MDELFLLAYWFVTISLGFRSNYTLEKGSKDISKRILAG